MTQGRASRRPATTAPVRKGADRDGDKNPECDGLATGGQPAIDEIPHADRTARKARERPRGGVGEERNPKEGLGGGATFEAKTRRLVGPRGDLLPPQVHVNKLDAAHLVRPGAHARRPQNRQSLRAVDGAFLEERR